MNIKLPKSLNKLKVKAIKNAPQILTAVGVTSIVAGFGSAIYATTKADKILDRKDEMMSNIRRVQDEFPDEYSELDHKKDLALIYAKTLYGFVKLYFVPAALTGLGIACILKSNSILNGRYKTAVAAYTGVLGAFNEYRKRVADELGEDKEKELYFNAKKVKAKITGEDGKEEKVNANVVNGYSPYAFFFDESANQWEKNPYYNKTFLLGVQNNMNIKLHEQGYVTLADVKNELSTDGVLVRPEDLCIGWVLGNGDDNVDLGIFEATNEAHRDFVNGIVNTILLDPNCDGWILDKM